MDNTSIYSLSFRHHLPVFDAYIVRHILSDIVISFDFANTLLFTSSILFGFTSLIIVSKERIDKRIWAVLFPPLVLIVLSGIAVGKVALGRAPIGGA